MQEGRCRWDCAILPWRGRNYEIAVEWYDAGNISGHRYFPPRLGILGFQRFRGEAGQEIFPKKIFPRKSAFQPLRRKGFQTKDFEIESP